MARTKIICTLGPASDSDAVFRNMARAGMDVARLNFSHGNQDTHRLKVSMVRRFNKKASCHIRILGDLEGHRIRIGSLKESKPIELKKRQTLWLAQSDLPGEGDTISFDYKGSLNVIRSGHNIFIDDGNICLEVTGRAKKKLKAKVIIGGILKEHKGVNIPEAELEFRGISQKDREGISFCEKNNMDFIAQSFVRTKYDITNIRSLLKVKGKGPGIIAKIENRDGIRNIDDIIEASDGIMIARGDMGISVPIYQIPVIQKTIIKRCNLAGKFVITATQMLESMTENHIPTRAEVTDVANAIIDGTDYVMLSAESAVGRYPVAAVSVMNKIADYTEGYLKGERSI